MAMFPREEIDAAFWVFHDALNESGRTGEWSHWGECLTPDATFVETELGRLGKREAIVRAVSGALTASGDQRWDALRCFPVEEYVIDENRGWVWSMWSPRFMDPGDGSLHQGRAFILLKYKGDGRFFYGETIYNPFIMQRAMESWRAANAAWDAQAEGRMEMLAAREEQARKMAPLKLDA